MTAPSTGSRGDARKRDAASNPGPGLEDRGDAANDLADPLAPIRRALDGMDASLAETDWLRTPECEWDRAYRACRTNDATTVHDALVEAEASLADLLDRLERAEAERDRLSRWKTEALYVMDGLQDIGRALDLSLGDQVTGPVALRAIEALKSDVHRLKIQARRAAHGMPIEAIAEKAGGDHA